MRALIFVTILLFSFSSYSQSIKCQGKVADTGLKGIPFAVIQVKGTSIGVYSDDQGVFTINAPKTSDTLIVYCLGYEKKEFPAKSWQTATIQLNEKSVNLTEVTISPRSKKMKIGMLGTRSRPYGQAFFGPGYEMGIYLDGSKVKNGYIKEVFLYVREEGIPTNKFRVHVYDADTITKLPNADITDSNVIAHAEKGGEWVKVDLSNISIPVKAGMIISMEWLESHGNDNKVITTGAGLQYKGQVLGVVPGDGTQFHYSRNFFMEQGETSTTTGLTPMIYCTYTYPK